MWRGWGGIDDAGRNSMNPTCISLSAMVVAVVLVGCKRETTSAAPTQGASDAQTEAAREQGRLGNQLFQKASFVVSVCCDEGDDTVMLGPTYNRGARATAGLTLSQLQSVAAATTNRTLAVVIMPAMCFNNAGFTNVQVLVERWGLRFPGLQL